MSKARYEIKFVLNELEFIEAKYFLKYINSFRSFPQREVTSLYYDTLDYSCVRDNLSGISKPFDVSYTVIKLLIALPLLASLSGG